MSTNPQYDLSSDICGIAILVALGAVLAGRAPAAQKSSEGAARSGLWAAQEGRPPATDDDSGDWPAPDAAEDPPGPSATPLARADVARLGTSVNFFSSSAAAARQAKQNGKLVFLLHVSGNFEESCFT